MVISEVLKKSAFKKDEIDEIIMGQVLTAGGGQNPARQAAINAGIPIKPAYSKSGMWFWTQSNSVRISINKIRSPKM